MVGLGIIFKIEVLRRLENAILNLVFANTVFHKRAMLNFNRRATTRKITENFFLSV